MRVEDLRPEISAARRAQAHIPAGLELLITCEHGGNRVPPECAGIFEGARDVLESHRGFDAGALDVARALSARVSTRIIVSETTRLLVDLNRSPRHPRLFSEFSRTLDNARKREVLAAHYTPYRTEVEQAVAQAVGRGLFVLHISSHSFVPVLDGVARRADVGLLFDPARKPEADFAAAWQRVLREGSRWTVRRNYPYRGVSDGLTTHLRRRFDAGIYAGLELEVNQRLVADSEWPRHVGRLAESLQAAVERWQPLPVD